MYGGDGPFSGQLFSLNKDKAYLLCSVQRRGVICKVRHHVAGNSRSIQLSFVTPQWGAADAEIKVPSVEKTELKGSPFKTWSRSVYSHGVGQFPAIHATLTARDFFLANF